MAQAFKIKLAAIAKDEGFYLPLWVYHHLRFGFDVLDIRVNDTTDNSWQVLEKLKVIYGARLRFSFADQEMEECRAKDLNFQAYIYKKIYEETLQEDFTHLIFLDIDEYWCSANFSTGIKDFLAEVNNFDVCMFQWLLEAPNHERTIDDFAFQPTIIGQKNEHVKSLLNMQAPVKALRIHNYLLKQGKYVLPDLNEVKFADTDRSRGRLPSEVFAATSSSLGNYFIYHQIFRSQEEYIASLLRGNKQNGDDSLLKTNRTGFLPKKKAGSCFTWQLPELSLHSYLQDYKKLAQGLNLEILLARQFVLARKQTVIDYLSEDIFLQQLHRNKMQGISAEIYTSKQLAYPLKVKLESMGFDEANNCCQLTCQIVSESLQYKLVITKAFSKEPLKAKISLMTAKQTGAQQVKGFQIEIDLVELKDIVYKQMPPFCLAAEINAELILLERAQFQELGEIVALKAEQLRKAALN